MLRIVVHLLAQSASPYSSAITVARTRILEALATSASGATGAILDGDDIVYSEAFGLADLATSSPLPPTPSST